MDVQDRLEVKMEPSTYKASGNLAKELEDELMKFTKKDEEDYKVDAHMAEQTEEVRSNTDMEVNITECTKSLGNEVFASVYQDTTESSSSFEDSSSGIKNLNTLDDSEAMSDFCDDTASALDFDGFSDKFRMRKKKLSTHWRSFIQPLMWRCKWVELQMKKLQAQSQQYDRAIEAYNKQKQIQLDNSALENGVKSLPFSQHKTRCDILKRKKRKRAEATTDIAAYMSHHNLFSYYENKKNSSDSVFMSNEIKTPVGPVNQKVNIDDEFLVDDDLLSAEPGDDDNSLEHLLYKIYNLQSKIPKLKERINKVLNENAGRFPCTDILPFTVPCNASPSNNGERMAAGTYIASQLLSEYFMSDALVPESGGTSHGDAADATGHVEDGALIDNQRVKDEMNTFEEVKIPQASPTSNEGNKNFDEETTTHSKDESGDATPSVLPTDEQPPPKTRSISRLTAPKGKRKRGRRKGGARWSRRSTS